jgi:uncharacterized protein (UPF0147 family)
MTMPSERTRAVIHAVEFLQKLSQDVSLPESIRRQARGSCATTRLAERCSWPAR